MPELPTDDAALARACGRNDRTADGSDDSIDARFAMIAVGGALGATVESASLGRYSVGKSLGRGGQGCVYEAFDPVLGRPVALKLSRFRGDDGALDLRFEAQALARISHPNVVSVYALERLEGRAIVVMERVVGRGLLEWVREQRPTPSTIIETIACIADGLTAIHRCGLAHRDVKPANILVDTRGVPRLVDLGLAAWVGTRGGGGGTPSYAAPEQLAGANDPASDQYGLGATLRAAMRAGNDGVVPPRLESIIARATNDNPTRRFPSMHAMAVALRARSRRRGGTMLAALGLTLLGAGALGGERHSPCGRDASALRDRVWSTSTQAELATHYDAIPHDMGREAFATTRGAIDQWLQQYTDAVAAVCETGPRRDDYRARCLHDGAHELESVIAELATLDEDTSAAAPMLARDLPSPERCIADEQVGPRVDPGPALEIKRSISLARRRCQYGLTDDCAAQWDAIERSARDAGVDPCVYEPAVLLERGAASGSGSENDDVALLEQAKLGAARCDLDEIELDAARMLADRLARRGAFDRARDQIRAAEAIFERMGRPPSDAVALLASRSIVELAAGNLPVAIEAAHEAIARHDELAWGAPGERAQLLGMLSAALFEQGDHERAAQLQLEALELRRAELGPRHPLVALALANAAVAIDTSDPVAARALNAEAIAIFERHERGHELSLAICLVHEAASAVEGGEVASAAASNARAVELFERFAHPDDPFAADAVINRARIRLARGELDDALGDARDALDRFTRTRGASDSSTLGARALLGDVLAARGDEASARRERCDAHAALVAAYGAEHPLVLELARLCPGAH